LRIFIAENKTGSLGKNESSQLLNESLGDFEYDNNNLFDKYFNSIDLFDSNGSKKSQKQKREIKIKYIFSIIEHLKSVDALSKKEEMELIEYYKDIYD
jgi:uroporphyrinogen-III decarboxylase